MSRHFLAVNVGEKKLFGETLFIPDISDGRPFELYWERLRHLAPIEITSLSVRNIATKTTEEWGFPHRSFYMHIQIKTLYGSGSKIIPVWYRENDDNFIVAGKSWWKDIDQT